MQLDEQYFKYNAQDWDAARPDVPNIMYVAATRARKQLIVIAGARDTLRTVDTLRLRQDAEVEHKDKIGQRRGVGLPDRVQTLSVSELTSHLTTELQFELLKMVSVVGDRRAPGVPSAPPYLVAFPAGDTKTAPLLHENVAVLYGIVGPAIAELAKNRVSTFGDNVASVEIVETEAEMRRDANKLTQRVYDAYPAEFWPAVEEAHAMPPGKRPLTGWMQLAVAQNAFDSGAHHVARQMRDYKWVDAAHVKHIAQAIVGTLKPVAGKFEVVVPPYTRGTKTVVGRADFVEGKTMTSRGIWEFKCSAEVRDEHLIQLACYLAMWQCAYAGADIIGHCYAVLSGEIKSIVVADPAKFLEMALSKYHPPKTGVPLREAIRAFEEGRGAVVASPRPEDTYTFEEPATSAAASATLDDLYS